MSPRPGPERASAKCRVGWGTIYIAKKTLASPAALVRKRGREEKKNGDLMIFLQSIRKRDRCVKEAKEKGHPSILSACDIPVRDFGSAPRENAPVLLRRA